VSVPSKPEFATNRAGEQVADALNAHLAFLRTTQRIPPELAIATAYFNAGGYNLLADELEHVTSVRLLLGAEPQVPERRVRALGDSPNPTRAPRIKLRKSLDGHARTLEEDRDLLGFTIDADTAGRRLLAWLNSGRVEVRRLEDGFLHGKAFIVTTHDEGVIAGSSNFTYAGLATNLELNLGHYQPAVVRQVLEWFDELWGRANPYDLAALYQARFEPHLPYVIYLRMLYERYGHELREEAEAEGVPQIHLTSFQRDGLWRARRILGERHGVLVADEVGLGKTFIAGELIREAVQERRQRVLVIAPATLRDGPWRKFLSRFQLGVECRSFDDLADGKLDYTPAEYALVVIDEAHNLRNPSTQRAEALRSLLGGTPPKDLVLLTATPVNNSLWDLYSLLYYFIGNDAAFADVGIRSLRDHFAKAMALNPDDLSPEHLFDVLDAVAVRRTRPFVKRYYPNDRVVIDGREVPITFPTPRVHRVTYDLDEVLPGFFGRFARALDGPTVGGSLSDPNVLTLARYAPSRYRLSGQVDAYEVQLAGLLRSGLLKRFESSAHAFACTCEKMSASHDAFLALLEEGKVATGAALTEWMATDSDELEVADYLERFDAELEHADQFDVDTLAADVTNDRNLLLAFAAEARQVRRQDDPKLAAIVDELVAIAEEATLEGIGETDTRDRRKVLIFSYFADTVDWVVEHVDAITQADPRLAAYRGRVVAISGTHGRKDDVLWGFAPRTTDAPPGRDQDRFDIVVTTDVLAEGVNLQQARHILNYDLPWNPMRLVQRHGRIDRIGSPHTEVFLRCVFPDRQLDDLLGLEARLEWKIKQAAASVGVGGEVLPGSRVEDVTFTETREEIERLRAGDASLFEEAGAKAGALSGEEYRQELRLAFENPDLLGRVQGLPWGSGSGMAQPGASPGYVFCARVADHPQVQFRYVDMTDPLTPAVVEDTLACLAHARPPDELGTPRVLDEATYQGAFGAWTHARDSIVASWNRSSDPANLVPPIPPAMQRAAELVRRHRPASMTLKEADRLIDVLEAPYPERTLRAIRQASASSEEPQQQVLAVAQTANDLGLQPNPPPRPLPEIEHDDVHLVCWLAIVPPATPSG
jgi:Helicase conserved C-terminal domain/PLD-like domain/SNF2-related domain